MDHRSFITKLAAETDTDFKAATVLSRTLAGMISTELSQGNSVALPGFGTFRPVKTSEHVDTDPATGKTTLIPPRIAVEFSAGSRLKKAISKGL